jgi:glucokinase
VILAGDVGGTKVELALYQFTQGQLSQVHEGRFAAKEFPGLEKILKKFLEESGITAAERASLVAACFGVPGPVRQGRLKLTNLAWEVDSHRLAADLNIEHVYLINDLEANGYGIAELAPDKIFCLSKGDPGAKGNRALMSAGTGLGEGALMWNGHVHVPAASEGGHGDFAARTDDEIELLRYLRSMLHGRVSCERVVSGIGLKNIYSFCRDVKGMEEPGWLKARMLKEDPNAVIGELGEEGGNALCAKTLDMFVSAYGAEAGNLALRILAVGGVYLGGGIAPKILAKMSDGAFMKAFMDKGRLSDLLAQVPVSIILDDKAALMGAAAYAEARAAEISGHSERAASTAPEPGKPDQKN